MSIILTTVTGTGTGTALVADITVGTGLVAETTVGTATGLFGLSVGATVGVVVLAGFLVGGVLYLCLRDSPEDKIQKKQQSVNKKK